MSLKSFKIPESPLQRKDEAHSDSWKQEIEEAIGRSSRELGIYNEKEVIEKLRNFYREIVKMKELEFIKELTQDNKEAGVYLVGGSVRDAVIDKPAMDIDLIINRIDPGELIEILEKYGRVIFDRNPKAELGKMTREEKEILIRDSYGVIKFHPKDSELGEPIDIALPREDDYEEAGQSGIRGIKRDTESKADPNLPIRIDLERRDLTINAMAINLVNGDIHDPFEGVDSIVKKEIRTVGNAKERILDEDLSRGFRAIRFACVFGAKLDTETKKAIKEIFSSSEKIPEELYGDDPGILKKVLAYEKEVRQVFNITDERLPKCLQVFWDKEQEKPRMAVARETISKEFQKAIEANPRRFIELLDGVGGLKLILPEIEALKHTEQSRDHHSEGDVFKHTMMLLDNLPKEASLRLKLAGLFHDIGKPSTQEKKEDGKIIFYGHDEKGVEIFRKIANRLKLPNDLKKDIIWLIENHMFPLSPNVETIKSTKLESRFLRDEELGKDLITLSQADALASIPETGEPNLENINKLISRIEELKKKSKGKEKVDIPQIITGKDLITLGLKPGPDFKIILEEIRAAQLDGRINTKDEALGLVQKIAVNE